MLTALIQMMVWIKKKKNTSSYINFFTERGAEGMFLFVVFCFFVSVLKLLVF